MVLHSGRGQGLGVQGQGSLETAVNCAGTNPRLKRPPILRNRIVRICSQRRGTLQFGGLSCASMASRSTAPTSRLSILRRVTIPASWLTSISMAGVASKDCGGTSSGIARQPNASASDRSRSMGFAHQGTHWGHGLCSCVSQRRKSVHGSLCEAMARRFRFVCLIV